MAMLATAPAAPPALPPCPPGLAIRPSSIPGAGRGVFVHRQQPFRRGFRLGRYGGQRLSQRQLDERYAHDALAPRCVQLADGTYVDDPHGQHWGSYVNDARGSGREPNVCLTADGHFVTLRTLADGEELLVDYGDEYWA